MDDDPLVRQQIAAVLKRNDMRVTELSSGQEFLDFMQENEPDLILLDMEMPGMDGFAALEKIRSLRNSLFHIPLIFLTEEEDEQTVNRGLSLGAMDFIRKPVVPGSLVMRIRHLLELVDLQGQFSHS